MNKTMTTEAYVPDATLREDTRHNKRAWYLLAVALQSVGPILIAFTRISDTQCFDIIVTLAALSALCLWIGFGVTGALIRSVKRRPHFGRNTLIVILTPILLGAIFFAFGFEAGAWTTAATLALAIFLDERSRHGEAFFDEEYVGGFKGRHRNNLFRDPIDGSMLGPGDSVHVGDGLLWNDDD